MTFVVAACEYSKQLKKYSAIASTKGYCVTTFLATSLMASICPFTKVVPSHAIPMTQMHAFMPLWKVLVESSLLVSTLHKATMRKPIVSMKLMIALSLVRIGFSTKPTLFEIESA